jgi:hypothetical protein
VTAAETAGGRVEGCMACTTGGCHCLRASSNTRAGSSTRPWSRAGHARPDANLGGGDGGGLGGGVGGGVGGGDGGGLHRVGGGVGGGISDECRTDERAAEWRCWCSTEDSAKESCGLLARLGCVLIGQAGGQ